jgi:periplasmic protein TonB
MRENPVNESSSRSFAERSRARSGPVYLQRIMVSLAAAILLIIGVIHLPINEHVGRIGWFARSAEIPASLELLPPVLPVAEGHTISAPVTDPGLQEAVPDDTGEGRGEALMDVPPAEDRRSDVRRIDSQRILSFVEQQPKLIGGLTGYYLNIEYPEEAREKGIQGRLMLSFVVETDGRASDILVEQSLHPLCDSAAVQALRRSRFVAGKHDGETVRVRMRLPVRFMLLDEPAPEPLPALTSNNQNVDES